MAPTDSWIDPERLSELARELTGDAPATVVEECTDQPEEGLLEEEASPRVASALAPPERNVVRIGEQLAEIKERATRSGLLRSVKGGPVPVVRDRVKRLPGTGASLVERLESFVSWAVAQEGLTGLFIADLAGNELVESGADPSLVASGVALAEGWERARGELESTAHNGVSTGASVRDAEGSMLTVYSCRSAYGRHVLGALTPESLGNALSAGLCSGFARVMGVGNA